MRLKIKRKIIKHCFSSEDVEPKPTGLHHKIITALPAPAPQHWSVLYNVHCTVVSYVDNKTDSSLHMYSIRRNVHCSSEVILYIAQYKLQVLSTTRVFETLTNP